MLKELVNIDGQLRKIFLRLEHALTIQLDPREIERVFSDSEQDQVSEKSYVFHQSDRVRVTGYVDGYEPETIWLSIEGDKSLVAPCVEILQ